MTDVTGSRRGLTLALVAVVFILSYIDRQAFSIYMPAISREMDIPDHEMGLIAGMSFSVFYLAAAFPIARLADRGDRPLIIALCVAVWSLATAACALAQSAVQLILIRIGLAAGEGGAGPAGQSLILHLFGKERRTLVLSTLLASSSLGLGAGGLIAGLLSRYYDWRTSLVIIGLPGLLVALAVWLLAAEPRRRPEGFTPPQPMPIGRILGVLVSSPSLRWIAATIIFVSMAGFPFIIWSGSFYQTVHHMDAEAAGKALFWPISGGLVIGNLLAGWLGDRFGKGSPKYSGRLAAIGVLSAFPFGVAMAQVADAAWSLRLFFIYHVLVTLHLGPMQALAFAQVPPAMRAMLGAAINMVITLCGIGIGTWLVGGLSSTFKAHFGDLSLRYSLTAVCFSLLVAAFCAIMAARTAKPLPDQS